jgi:hypothetical protein
MKAFEHGDLVETTLGNGTFVEMSNGGQSYKIYFTDGPNEGTSLSVGERAIKNLGRDTKSPRVADSKYAPYEGNESIFDAPIDFNREGMEKFLLQSNKWTAIIYSCPDSVERAVRELKDAGLENPTDYIHVAADTAHGVKYDLMIPDPEIPDLDLKLGIFFNPIRLASSGMYQVGRKEFVLAVLSKVRVLEVGEKL